MTGSCETQRDYAEFAATQKAIELKRNLQKITYLQGQSSEGRCYLYTFLFLKCTVHLNLIFFFSVQTTCSNF